MITVTSHSSLADIPISPEEWDDLVDRSFIGAIFCRQSWISTWWQHFGSEFELLFLVAEQDGKPVGFAPLMIDSSSTIRFIADEFADYLDFVIAEDYDNVALEFFRFVRRHARHVNVMHLRNVQRLPGYNNGLLEASRRAGLHPWLNYSMVAPFLQISGHEDSVRARLQKYSIRRATRQLAERGTLTYRVLKSPVDAANFWEVFSEQHRERCKAARRRSPFATPGYLQFLRTLFEDERISGTVHFSAVLLNDQPVAFHFGFISEGRLLWYKPSFDASIKKGSPGIVLICRLIAFALEHDLEELDFTIGDEAFKRRFSNETRIVDSFRIHRNLFTCRLESGYWWLRNRLKSTIARRP